MKFALITDQHFGSRNDSIAFLDFYEKFYKDVFFHTLEKESIKTLLILGDTFDRRKYVNFFTLKRTKQMFFDGLQEMGITVHMLAGNHDTYFKNTNSVNSVSLLLQEYDNINVIDTPQTIDVEGTRVCMMPWICPENYEESMNELSNTDASICCGHFEIAGFAMYRGMQSEEGLNRVLFRKFTHTFSGHYHHKSTDGDISYLGTPYELTWQDYSDTRGFHLYDPSLQELEFIKNPHVMFHRIIYDDKVESITEINKKDLSKYTNTYVKVVVINKTNPYLFDKFMANLYLVNPIDVTIAEDYTELTDESEDDILDQSEDTVTIINKVIDGSDMELDKSKLKNIFKELYIEAVNLEQS